MTPVSVTLPFRMTLVMISSVVSGVDQIGGTSAVRVSHVDLR